MSPEGATAARGEFDSGRVSVESSRPVPDQALEGIRVLDFTRALAGPSCTRYLADLGAEVLKIEPPHVGDMVRNLAPPAYAQRRLGGHFMFVNCSKKGLCLDLKRSEARDVVYDLVKVCDVVVENFSAGTIERLKFGYDTLARINPSVIMCSISGYGQTGQYRGRRGGEWDIEATSGVMDLTGEMEGPPQPVGLPLCDIITGLFAFGAICAALRYREITGVGQFLDLGMLDSVVSTSMLGLPDHLLSGGSNSVTRGGRFRYIQAVRGLFRGQDGWIHISAMTDSAAERLAEMMGQPELLQPGGLATPEARKDPARTPQLYKLIEEWVLSFSSVKEVEQLLNHRRVTATVVRSTEEMVNDPNTWERGMLVKLPHPDFGEVTLQTTPFKLSRTPSRIQCLPPRVGEHNKEVLNELLGYSLRQVAQLLLDEVIWTEEELQAEILAAV